MGGSRPAGRSTVAAQLWEDEGPTSAWPPVGGHGAALLRNLVTYARRVRRVLHQTHLWLQGIRTIPDRLVSLFDPDPMPVRFDAGSSPSRWRPELPDPPLARVPARRPYDPARVRSSMEIRQERQRPGMDGTSLVSRELHSLTRPGTATVPNLRS